MIDNEAGMDLTYSQYPRNPEFIPDLIKNVTNYKSDILYNTFPRLTECKYNNSVSRLLLGLIE